MLFSIVMPVYNVEIYLERAIRSIVNQSFISWELILVDDGSNDRSVQWWMNGRSGILVYGLFINEIRALVQLGILE